MTTPASPVPATTSSTSTRWLSGAIAALEPRRLPAVGRWLPPADSVAFYAALAIVGIVEIVEWPAVLIAAGAQVLLDRRLGPLEARLARPTAPPPWRLDG